MRRRGKGKGQHGVIERSGANMSVAGHGYELGLPTWYIASAMGLAVFATLVLAVPVAAQQATGSGDVRAAYGSRLTLEAVPEVSRGVVSRLNTRVQNRVNSRLSTRIERYAVTNDPTESLRTRSDEGAARPVIQGPLPPPD